MCVKIGKPLFLYSLQIFKVSFILIISFSCVLRACLPFCTRMYRKYGKTLFYHSFPATEIIYSRKKNLPSAVVLNGNI